MSPSLSPVFSHAVGTRYHIFNSLFLNLPYQGIFRTGTLLPLLQQYCEDGFAARKTPTEIIENFFKEFTSGISESEKKSLLFNFIQYVERQVVLFDSIEDAAFEEVHNVNGKGTVSALLLRAKSEEKEIELREKLDGFKVRVVLTAHPTQFYPGSVLAILTDLEKAIRENNLEHINLLLHQLGKTRFINKQKPTPFDEASSLSWYLENVFYQSIPDIITKLAAGLEANLEEWKNTDLISVGFWPGGDRDGNPFVTNETTWQVAQHLRERILKNYHKEIRILKRRLTFKGVDEIIQQIEKKITTAIQGVGGYSTPVELLEDLSKARQVLISDHEGLFLNLLEQVILKVRIFGFHFASLDIRQHSAKYDAIWNHTFANILSGWSALADQEKIKQILGYQSSLPDDEPLFKEEIESFRSIKKIQQSVGIQACHRYIISNCSSALNVIEVFQLARMLTASDGELALDVIPLFESIDDLANASQVITQLFSIPEYLNHVKHRGSKQVIMLGFSDGTKDGGYLRANWSIFRAKEQLTAAALKFGVTAIFFDGRGGPPARGGGNTHDFYASLGPTIESSEIQITIQGQTISSNFGKLGSCTYNLEQLLSAGIENDVFAAKPPLNDQEKNLLDQLANVGYQSYLKLKLHQDFTSYLQEVTPLPFFGDSNIGSRPAKRTATAELKLEDLRAIPFVGTWAQMKQNIPGFFGVGSALQELFNNGLKSQVQHLFQSSLFFRTLLSNSMMSLTKTYYPATSHLQQDDKFGPIWRMMFEEYQLSRNLILEVSGQKELMQSNGSIRESIKLRERIVLPLIAIQQYALQKIRKEKEPDPVLRTLIVRCMFGIINAARNSA
jgi:phosphoenolpyruvate carboxylase